jgi:hypothetical protein
MMMTWMTVTTTTLMMMAVTVMTSMMTLMLMVIYLPVKFKLAFRSFLHERSRELLALFGKTNSVALSPRANYTD